MQYELGIDLGTTFTAAAIHRDGRLEMAMLGSRAASVPSVVFLRDDETILTGEAAERRGFSEPERVAREFKRRVGDPTPLLLGGTPYSAERLMAKLLRWVVDSVTEREGAAPARVAVSHPANWGPYKLDLLSQAVRLADLGDAVTISEPEAAARWYASTERVEPGDVVAVYDLGGGTFDAAILRQTETGFEILGRPEGIERLGGIDFDEAVFAHVRRVLGDAIASLDPDDPAAMTAIARLRHDCVDAKEALSSDTDARIPVLLPGVQTEVRITRAELEAMVRPPLAETIESLQRALASAGVSPTEVRAVLLVGGSSRIPLVAQLVSAEFGRPVAVDAHPKHAIAMGAALAAAGAGATTAPPAAEVAATRPAAESQSPAASAPVAPASVLPAAPVVPGASAPVAPATPFAPSAEAGPQRRNGRILAVTGGVLVVTLAFWFLVGRGGDAESGDDRAVATTSSPATAPVPVTCEGPSGRCTRIQGVGLFGDRYVVDFMVSGFEPHIGCCGDDSHHLHFYFDSIEAENAGTNGPSPESWEMYDGASPFTAYGQSQRPPGATQLCVLVADTEHAVEVGTGNCHELPG